MSPFRLIVGLGNPGSEYRNTRHNVGYMVVDRLAGAIGAKFQTEKAWRAELGKAPDLLLCKPLTYMNLAGEAVRLVTDFYKILPAEILVVLDDMALPVGKLRLRARGSSGGHNGLQSLLDHLGTEDVARLRVGIGMAEPGDATSHVLGYFNVDEREELEEALGRAVDAINLAQQEGLQFAMNAYN
jgi:peptidyl-tRNA hydrolase, PTH1 family